MKHRTFEFCELPFLVKNLHSSLEIGSAFLCMVPNGLSVDSEYFADERGRDNKTIFRPHDSADGRTLLAKGQTDIETVVPQKQLEEVKVRTEHF
jgi:predicted SAM-dependent methyltransferase